MNQKKPYKSYYSPCAALWYSRWRHLISMAKAYPLERNGYERAACIAQTQYVVYLVTGQ